MTTPPPPPPEADLIRLVREAAGIKLPAAALAAGISKARWSQIECGYETRGGGYKEVHGRAVTIAHMAHAVGLTPERLETEGARPDAARILREILRTPQVPVLEVVSPAATPREDLGIQSVLDDPGLTDDEKRGIIALIMHARERNGPKVSNG